MIDLYQRFQSFFKLWGRKRKVRNAELTIQIQFNGGMVFKLIAFSCLSRLLVFFLLFKAAKHFAFKIKSWWDSFCLGNTFIVFDGVQGALLRRNIKVNSKNVIIDLLVIKCKSWKENVFYSELRCSSIQWNKS